MNTFQEQKAILEAENLVIKSVKGKMRDKMTSVWSIIIILTNLIHIEIAINTVSAYNTELNSSTMYFGVAALLAWFSLNRYLTYNTEYAYMPRTMMNSSSSIFNGLVGIMPVMIGAAFYTTTVLYS